MMWFAALANDSLRAVVGSASCGQGGREEGSRALTARAEKMSRESQGRAV